MTAATVTFRSRGSLQLTAIVKATFALTPEARMTPLVPDPIIPAEIPDPSGRGLRSAGDLAPYLGETDVLLTGHAEVLPTFLATELRIWLAVLRGGVARIDRWLELDASARVGQARGHVHIDGAGPLSREWPRRSQLLEGLDPRHLHGPLVEIPEGLDWTYFQAAPAEQRMELLRGDEWLVLGGVFAQRPRLRTQLPEARGVAQLYRRGEQPPRVGVPIPLVADTLVIDVDRRCVSILWRGHVPVEEAELASLHVVAGVELAGRETVLENPFPGEDYGVGTIVVPLEVSRKLAAAPAMPFVKPDESTLKPAAALEGTFKISDELARKLAGMPSTPFVKPAEARPEEEGVLEGTFMIPDEVARKLAAAPATPFRSHWDTPLSQLGSSPAIEPEEDGVTLVPPAPSFGAPEAENLLGGTFQVPDDIARKLAGLPATPFERVDRSAEVSVEAPWVEAVEASDDWISEDLSEDVLTPLAAMKVAPPVSVAKPALLIAPEDESSEQPLGLGAEFLAAMSAEGETA
ncbi:MAG: DUF2169 domain-containing protein [Byssovorax sp.]